MMIAVTLAFAAFLVGCDALSCVALNGMNNNTCSGANYCQSLWVGANGNYVKIYSVCIRSTYQLPTGWTFTSQAALKLTCNSGDFCNAARPKPNQVPPTPPPQITCMQTGGGSTCMATVCSVSQRSFQGLKQSCDISNTLTKQLMMPPHSFCTYTNQGSGTDTYYCSCNNTPNCNTNQLLVNGVLAIDSIAKVTCYAGNNMGGSNAQGQYCMTASNVQNGVLSLTYSAAATTAVPPHLGCQTVYGYGGSNTYSTTCYCNTNYCNGPIQSTMRPTRTNPPFTIPPISGAGPAAPTFFLLTSALAIIIAHK